MNINALLDYIQETEGLGNRTATFTFLIKYYLLTKKNSLDISVDILDKLIDKKDIKNLKTPEEQLNDV